MSSYGATSSSFEYPYLIISTIALSTSERAEGWIDGRTESLIEDVSKRQAERTYRAGRQADRQTEIHT